MGATPYTNHLSNETSPYLLQHAHNPVEWYPWCEEALDRARRENKPILLSVGYSACHWCHVMAHESFEDPDTAAVMNKHYVNIKVDREERPDLDKVYQLAHQLLNQRGGGWPLNVILTPDDHTPFFAGTYFPPLSRHGLPAFKDLLEHVAEVFRTRRADINEQNAALLHALRDTNPPPAQAGQRLNSAPLDQARRELERAFDSRRGGFGSAPKFPHPTNIERLLRHWAATASADKPDEHALHMARFTLHAMASGGIYDQLGGGFCRYSVDENWMIPHFEKMLYDNGPLLALYAEAWKATGDSAFRRVCAETGDWVMREMQSPEGGYYSTLDADSEGVEGKFYVWTPDSVREAVSPEEYAVLAAVYGLDRPANFEGHWHLHVFDNVDDVAKRSGISADQARALLHSGRHRLLALREQRVRPGRDDKVLTAWNALMIKGMASAGRHLDRSDFIASAERALNFVRDTLYQNGRLLASYKDGRGQFMGYLDDYALLIDAVLELLQARWREGDLAFAIELADSLLEHFEDTVDGGFYFTAHDHEQLVHRPKPLLDESTPAGNGVAAYALGRLGHLLGETRYLEAVERTLKNAWPQLTQMPYAHGSLLLALEEHLYPAQTVVLRGQGQELTQWREVCSRDYAPRRCVIAIPNDVNNLPQLLAERRPQSEAVAYVCSGHTCQAPVTELGALEETLSKT